MSASSNLARLNTLLTNIDGADEYEEHAEEEEESDSEEDYVISDANMEHLQIPEVCTETLLTKWREQRGLCRITNIPIDLSSHTGLYSGIATPRRMSRPLDDSNVYLVLRSIAVMRDALDLNWTQFRSLIRHLAHSMDEV